MTADTSLSLPVRSKKSRWSALRENLLGYAFIFPAFLIIGLFGLFPIGFSVYVSMHRWRITPGRFLGLDNYVKALDNLAYVIFFWIAAIFLYMAIQRLRKVIVQAKEANEGLWIWIIPAVLSTAGIIAFLRFAVLLLPEVLGVADKLRGQERTRELFVSLLGEAWRMPVVQSALRLTLLIFVLAFAALYLINRYLRDGHASMDYYAAITQVVIYVTSGLVLGWYTWAEIVRAYAEALEEGETLAIWAQVTTISAGFLLLLFSWLLWRSASNQDTNRSMIFRLVAASMLAVGAWTLIGELPRVIDAGYADWWNGLRVTVFYSVGTVPFQLGISLMLAVLLFQNIKGKSFFRLIYFLPYITPAVATAAVFRTFFSGRPTAPFNSILGFFGADPLLWLDEPAGIINMLFGTDFGGWLAGPSLALVVVIIFNIWTYIGYDTVIFLAGLGGISNDLYEAAAIDGASSWDQFRHITLPLLSPTTYFLTLLAVIGTFKAFNHIWVLRSAAALGTVDTASLVIFNEFNRNTRYGYASSLAFVLLGVILVLTLVNNKIAEKRVFYG